MTIGEHICSDKALTCGSVAIRVNKAVHCRVIIAALQIIEAGFYVIVIPTVAQGVPVGQGRAGGLLIHQAGAVAVGNANELAPGIVGIGGVDLSRPANEIPVGILHRHGANTVSVIGIICCFSTGRDLHKLAAILPC